MKVLVLIFAFAALAAASKGGSREHHEEHYGYVEVRPGAHMFWVMYHVNQTGNHTDYPLIMWLQGGPGASGVGYGNFEELGPYDINGNPREHAWTEKANVLFVDNPVGTGYSYVDEYSLLASNNAMIASDLVTCVKAIFTEWTDMQVMPFYVFAESYGGKMTVDFALEFDKAVKNGEVVSDFRGVALGDSWISPMDSVNTWGTFLYHMGLVTQQGQTAIDNAAGQTQDAVDSGQWVLATNMWSYTELVVMQNANNVNFYNVLAENDIYLRKKGTNATDLSFMSPEIRRLYENHVAHQTRDALDDYMNGQQADEWGIPDSVKWGGQGGMVFDTLAGDFMKPVVDSVVRLITETDLEVVVFTGNLDLICDTPGTYRWIENMEWPDKPSFMSAHNDAITIPIYSSPAATIQKSGRFSLYTILRSGHMVPIDAPEMALKMLDMIFASSKKPAKQAPVEKADKQKAPKQEVPEPKEESLQEKLSVKYLKEEALKKEAKKEQEAAKEVKKQKENKEEQKEDKKQEVPQGKKAPKEKQPKKISKKEKAPKQEKPKQKEIKKEAAPKQEKYKEKVARPDKNKQKAPEQKEKKQEAPKKKAPEQKEKKQETPKKEPEQKFRKQEAKKVINKAKAKVIASRLQQQQRNRPLGHNPGPLPDPPRRR